MPTPKTLKIALSIGVLGTVAAFFVQRSNAFRQRSNSFADIPPLASRIV